MSLNSLYKDFFMHIPMMRTRKYEKVTASSITKHTNNVSLFKPLQNMFKTNKDVPEQRLDGNYRFLQVKPIFSSVFVV